MFYMMPLFTPGLIVLSFRPNQLQDEKQKQDEVEQEETDEGG
jgi:hypothetical protein